VVSPTNNWLNPTYVSHTRLVLTYVRSVSLAVWLSEQCCSRRFLVMLRCRIGLKYIPVIRNGYFYCSFGTSSTRTIILVCKPLHNIEFWLRKKYLSFVNDNLTNVETEWPKIIQVTKWFRLLLLYFEEFLIHNSHGFMILKNNWPNLLGLCYFPLNT